MPMMLTVEKSLEIIEAVARSKQGIGTRALARELGINVTTVHNIAATLKHYGFLRQQQETKRFLPGLRLMMLGRHNSFLELMTQIGRPFIQKASKLLDESVMLAVLDAGRVVNLTYVPSTQALRVHEDQDISPQAYCIACGKVLLAAMPPQAQQAYANSIELTPFTKNTIVDRALLVAEIQKVRQQGYATTQDEAAEGVSAVAVPVADPWGHTIASIGASAPSIRFRKPGYREHSLDVLRQMSQELSQTLAKGLISPSPAVGSSVGPSAKPALA